jgi:hypothetical protein
MVWFSLAFDMLRIGIVIASNLQGGAVANSDPENLSGW